jgi:hypothetical protein
MTWYRTVEHDFQRTSPIKEKVSLGTGEYLKFDYVNNRGGSHSYVVRVESVELGTYDTGGHHPNVPENPDNLKFVLNGIVYMRDDNHRGLIRRTFVIEKIKNISVVIV